MKRIAYIILNYKTYQDTDRVTKEILSYDKVDDIIIIVDNCSPNESSKELHRLYDRDTRVSVVDTDENGGYAKGNNFGLRYAKKFNPEYVCIINNDVHFSGETIDYLVRIYRMLPDVGIISPIQVMPNNEVAQFPILKFPDFEYDIRSYLFLFGNPQHKYQRTDKKYDVQEVGIIPGAFLFADYKLIEEIDFFDESTFLFCEERFLAKKIKDAGLKNYIILNKSYVHEHSKTINSEASVRKQMKMILSGRLLYTKKYRKLSLIKSAIIYLAYYYRVVGQFIIERLKTGKALFLTQLCYISGLYVK